MGVKMKSRNLLVQYLADGDIDKANSEYNKIQEKLCGDKPFYESPTVRYEFDGYGNEKENAKYDMVVLGKDIEEIVGEENPFENYNELGRMFVQFSNAVLHLMMHEAIHSYPIRTFKEAVDRADHIQDFDSEFEEGYKLVKASKNATIRTIRL